MSPQSGGPVTDKDIVCPTAGPLRVTPSHTVKWTKNKCVTVSECGYMHEADGQYLLQTMNRKSSLCVCACVCARVRACVACVYLV